MECITQEKEAEISEAAIRWVHSRYGNDIPSVLIIDGNDWHLGVIGIVAAKVAQEFSRPTAILSLQPDGTAMHLHALFLVLTGTKRYLNLDIYLIVGEAMRMPLAFLFQFQK